MPAQPPVAGKGGTKRAKSSPATRTKYGAVRTSYNGVVYDSKKEAGKAAELDLLKRAGKIGFWLYHVSFPLPGGDRYESDFMTFAFVILGEYPWWSVAVIEVKGYWTALSKNKFKRFKQAYPSLRVSVE